MPETILRARPIAWTMYALLALAGVFFGFTEDSASVQAIIGAWAPSVTAVMLVLGALVGVSGSVLKVYRVELAAYPFLVGVWAVYAIAIGARAWQGETPAGFAFLLGAGAVSLYGRATELFHAEKITRDLIRRQAARGGTV